MDLWLLFKDYTVVILGGNIYDRGMVNGEARRKKILVLSNCIMKNTIFKNKEKYVLPSKIRKINYCLLLIQSTAINKKSQKRLYTYLWQWRTDFAKYSGLSGSANLNMPHCSCYWKSSGRTLCLCQGWCRVCCSLCQVCLLHPKFIANEKSNISASEIWQGFFLCYLFYPLDFLKSAFQ